MEGGQEGLAPSLTPCGARPHAQAPAAPPHTHSRCQPPAAPPPPTPWLGVALVGGAPPRPTRPDPTPFPPPQLDSLALAFFCVMMAAEWWLLPGKMLSKRLDPLGKLLSWAGLLPTSSLVALAPAW